MTKLRNLVLTVSFCLCAFHIQAQFTRQQAIDLVLTEVVDDDITEANVFAEYVVRSDNNPINLHYSGQVSCPYNQNWVFFVDDLPLANWNHDCRYIFVNA